jgi:hypothetical protein
MRKVLLATCAAGGLLLLCTAPAAAQSLPDITVDQRVPATGRAAPGSVHLVGSDDVDPALVGGTCDVNVNLANNQSVHPNSDLLITSGSNTVVALDVERDADAIIDTTPGLLLLEDDTITVSVRLGPDGLFSGGFTISFACTPPPPPTTAPPTTVTPPANPTAPPNSAVAAATSEAQSCQPAGSAASGREAANGQSERCAGTLPHTGPSTGAAVAGAASLIAGLTVLAGVRRHRPRPID